MFTRFRYWRPFFLQPYLRLAVLLNWPAEISNKTNRLRGSLANRQIEGMNAAGSTQPARIILGGWPFTFTITNEFENGPPSKHFVWTNLLGDMLVCGMCCFSFGFTNDESTGLAGANADPHTVPDRRGNVATTQNPPDVDSQWPILS